MKLFDEEYWDVKCVDEFEKYHKNLTDEEIKKLRRIRKKIFSTSTPEYNIKELYREAIEILHEAWKRKFKKMWFTFKDISDDYEETGTGYFGVSRAWK